jgi:hypothetical protein
MVGLSSHELQEDHLPLDSAFEAVVGLSAALLQK